MRVRKHARTHLQRERQQLVVQTLRLGDSHCVVELTSTAEELDGGSFLWWVGADMGTRVDMRSERHIHTHAFARVRAREHAHAHTHAHTNTHLLRILQLLRYMKARQRITCSTVIISHPKPLITLQLQGPTAVNRQLLRCLQVVLTRQHLHLPTAVSQAEHQHTRVHVTCDAMSLP